MHRTQTMMAAMTTVLISSVGLVDAAPIFVGPTSYTSQADRPAGFYAGAGPTFLEDFEDFSLDGGITASTGVVISPGGSTDSVDADDGTIDGFGTAGRSWFSGNGVVGVTFTFPQLVTAAGAVWTDGAGTTSFEAFGPGMVSLGTIGPVAIADASHGGTTGEDRFFGVQDPNGILAIKLSNSAGGIEIDHVQYGQVPEPTSAVLLGGLVGLGWLGGARRQRR